MRDYPLQSIKHTSHKWGQTFWMQTSSWILKDVAINQDLCGHSFKGWALCVRSFHPPSLTSREQLAISQLSTLWEPPGGFCSLSSAHSALKLPKDRLCLETSQGEQSPGDLGTGHQPWSCRTSAAPAVPAVHPSGSFVPKNCSFFMAEAAGDDQTPHLG